MKVIIGYISGYFYETDKRILVLVSALAGFLIFSNYHFHLDARISGQNSFGASFSWRALIFFTAFFLPYLVYSLFNRRAYFSKGSFIVLLLLAPLVFSFKVAFNPRFYLTGEQDTNAFWDHVIYWPSLLVITAAILFITWKIADSDQPFYGIKTRGINWKPYFTMLLIMLPLITLASTQPDFQAMYPKLKLITDDTTLVHLGWWHKLLFELSYGSDFITIELFFRGFLILAFIKWAGKDAILPMACFYCTIHFGKPLGECISSYFGGMILGIIVYHTRSIFGGLMVHLGIAWMMEIGGFVGNAMH